jgi:uncharacterized protein with PIN domain
MLALLFDEPHSGAARKLLERDSAMLVRWATSVECLAAIARQERDGRCTRSEAERLRDAVSTLSASWTEVLAGEQVREHAGRLVLRHPLRAPMRSSSPRRSPGPKGAHAGMRSRLSTPG